MGNYGVPPEKTDFLDVPDDIYEAFVLDVEEIPNEWYNPEKDNKNKQTQLQWKLVIREAGEFQGQTLLYFTGAVIGRHPKNKLTNLVKILDPEFNIDVAYSDEEDFRNHVVERPLRVTTEITEKKKSEGTYAKVVGVLKSKLGDLTGEEIMRLSIGAKDL